MSDTPMKKIVVGFMHKLAHTQYTEHTITTVFRKQQGTSKMKTKCTVCKFTVRPFIDNRLKSSRCQTMLETEYHNKYGDVSE